MNAILMQLMGVLAEDSGGNGNGQVILMVGVILAIMAFMLVSGRGQKKERLAREKMLDALARNDRVLTRTGMIGVVADIKDDEIVLKVDENTNTKIRMKKWTVVALLNKDGEQVGGGEK